MSAGSDVATLQSATGVLMVRPARFAHNAQTSSSNRFQQSGAQTERTSKQAVVEFDGLARAIAASGIAVCCVEDTPEPAKPDAAFPNNWVSFHRDGGVVLYPMLAANRRAERRMDILQRVAEQLQFRRRCLIDLSNHELHGRYLEGTGSLVLDHTQRIAYACRSPRTDESLVRSWSQQLAYEPLLFDASGADGTAIYHTNVLLSIGTGWAVVCAEAIAVGDRRRILRRLQASHEVIAISMPLMLQFAANVLELRAPQPGAAGRRLLAMSERARTAFEQLAPDSWARLRACVDQVLVVPIPTIESVGGGGVRCMLAEVPEVTT